MDLAIQQKKKDYISNSRADETKRAIAKHWRHFIDWCDNYNKDSYPCSPEILCEYLIFRAGQGVKIATIDQVKWAIDFRHRVSDMPTPGDSSVVKSLLAGIKRKHRARIVQKKALTPDNYKKLSFDDNHLQGLREKMIILLGFAGAFRRSELAGIMVEDIEQTKQGLRINLLFSKTNQEGAIEYINIVRSSDSEYCPVEAVSKWLSDTGIKSGALIRSINKSGKLGEKLSTVSIAKIIKLTCAKIGLDYQHYSGHSLRAGFATYALDNKIPPHIVAKHLRHKKLETTLRYDRNSLADALENLY